MTIDAGADAAPATLDHAGIAARIPHHGRMCLLDRLEDWSANRIHCSATSHGDPDNPLRSNGGELLAVCAIEYAAQAMALHGSLVAPRAGPPQAGYIAAVRDVRLSVPRLDDVAGALRIAAERLAGDASVVCYRFEVDDGAGRRLVDGRATVVLNPR